MFRQKIGWVNRCYTFSLGQRRNRRSPFWTQRQFGGWRWNTKKKKKFADPWWIFKLSSWGKHATSLGGFDNKWSFFCFLTQCSKKNTSCLQITLNNSDMNNLYVCYERSMICCSLTTFAVKSKQQLSLIVSIKTIALPVFKVSSLHAFTTKISY